MEWDEKVEVEVHSAGAHLQVHDARKTPDPAVRFCICSRDDMRAFDD